MSGGSITGNSTTVASGYDSPPIVYGGGVHMTGGTFSMSGGTISENFAYYNGGGVSTGGGGSSGTFTMSGGTITGNSAYSGGGVSVSGGTFTMSKGTIVGNSAIATNFSSGSAGGGGVSVGYGSTFTMSGGTIMGNSTINNAWFSNYGGGGISVEGTFTMSGGTISGNFSDSSSLGSGVYVTLGKFAISNNARIDASNEVCLGYGSIWDGSSSYTSYAAITIAGDFSGSDTIAVIDLYSENNVAANWLWKSVLLKDAGYTGTIPVSRFSLGNFVSSNYSSDISKTPITNYVINSDGRLANK
jgi:hypothetical protein